MFKGMEYVYEVYKEHSFSKAAKNLFISQPSLSASIKKTETELGFEIFDRSTKPIGLTEFGKAYIESIEKILEIQENFENYANDLSDLQAGKLTVGGTNLFTSYILPPIISNFSKKYPKIAINIVETTTANLEKQLFNGDLDIIIDNYDFDDNIYEKEFFAHDNIILAVPKDFSCNVLAQKYQICYEDIVSGKYINSDFPTVPLNIFKDSNFIFLKEGNDTRKRADKICHRSRFSPKMFLELDQQITAYNLACFGIGITFVSDILIKYVPRDNNLVFYKLETQDAGREIAFFYKKYKYIKKSTQEFLKIAAEFNNLCK